MDSNLPNVIEILDKIRELESNGSDLIEKVPDNESTCSVQVKFYVSAIIDRAKEQCDYCIEMNLDKEKPTDMNVSCKRFLSLEFNKQDCNVHAIGFNRTNERIVL